MKIIVTHASPDWDAIGSVWLLKKFLPGWQDALVEFVPAGQRSERLAVFNDKVPNEKVIITGEDEIIHVDTGLLPLDHHQTPDKSVCAASLVWDFVREEIEKTQTELKAEKQEAVDRIVRVIVAIDHFREVFWDNPTADYHEFSLLGVLEGLKQLYPDQDQLYIDYGIQSLEALEHNFENRIWAEHEIAEKGIIFQIKNGRAIGFETVNDTVLKLAQKMGFLLVVRKDPRKGYVRIKLRPSEKEEDDLDLTPAYEKLKELDPQASWFLHVSKKMLLNGTPKNPKMVPTKMSLSEIISVLEKIY